MTSPLEKWPISIRGELKIRPQFERNGLDERYNCSEDSNKPNEDHPSSEDCGKTVVVTSCCIHSIILPVTD